MLSKMFKRLLGIFLLKYHSFIEKRKTYLWTIYSASVLITICNYLHGMSLKLVMEPLYKEEPFYQIASDRVHVVPDNIDEKFN